MGTVTAIPACLICPLGCSLALQGKHSFPPVSPNHGSWFGLGGTARTTGFVLFCWFRLRWLSTRLPSRHPKAAWFSHMPFPVSWPSFLLPMYHPFSTSDFPLQLLFPCWSLFCCLYTQIWHFWNNYLDDLSLLWRYWYGYLSAAGLAQLCCAESPQRFPSVMDGIHLFFM